MTLLWFLLLLLLLRHFRRRRFRFLHEILLPDVLPANFFDYSDLAEPPLLPPPLLLPPSPPPDDRAALPVKNRRY